MPLDVLFVEDSETDTRLIVHELERFGYRPRWERVESVAALRDALLRRRWQVVLSDSSVAHLPPGHALALTKELGAGAAFIVVSGTVSAETVVQSLRDGASDYVTKEDLSRLGAAVERAVGDTDARGAPGAQAPLEPGDVSEHFGQTLTTLRLALESAARKGSTVEAVLPEALALLQEAMQARDLSAELRPTSLDDQGIAVEATLTPRQREVLQLIAEGSSTKQIAKRLGLGVKTVETHRAQVMSRLDIHDVAGLVRYAIRMGIVSAGR